MKPNNSYHLRDFSVRREEKTILKSINLSLPSRSITSVVGPSGSGKTTLLHALAGFIPSQGERPENIPTGIVFQHNGVFPFMTVKENLLFALQAMSAEDADERCAYFMEAVDLTEYMNVYPSRLSGGQVQRLNFARALAGNPSLLLCDEPFSSLDEVTRMSLQEWLSNYLTSLPCTSLLVTHSIEEAIYLADTVLILAGGTIIDSVPIFFPRPRSSGLKFTAPFVEAERYIFQLMQRYHNE